MIVLETDSENQDNHENSIDIYSYQQAKMVKQVTRNLKLVNHKCFFLSFDEFLPGVIVVATCKAAGHTWVTLNWDTQSIVSTST